MTKENMLMDLYNSIQNPLDSPEVMKEIIKTYTEVDGTFLLDECYYDELIKRQNKEYNHGEFYQSDHDAFHAMLFNKWKASIVNTTGKNYEDGFLKLRDFLKTVNDVSTAEEVTSILVREDYEPQLKEALNEYFWSSIGRGSGWTHVSSHYLTAFKDKFPKIEHRLYLNTEAIDTYKMVMYFIQKCDEHHLPYYFKFDLWGNRDDTVVIYSDNKHLLNYIQVLREIKKEHPEFVQNMLEPPVLCGNIDGFIGYGSEPVVEEGEPKTSFNVKRASILYNAIDKVNKKWISDNIVSRVSYNDKIVPFEQLLIEFFAISFINKLIDDFYSDQELYGRSKTEERLGYSLSEIQSHDFQKRVRQMMSECSVIEKLKEYCNPEYTNCKNGVFVLESTGISMKTKSGKTLSLGESTLLNIIRGMALIMMDNSPEFIEDVREEIRNTSENYGIDKDNFCFDIRTLESMKKHDELQVQRKVNRNSVQHSVKQAQMTRDNVLKLSNRDKLGVNIDNYRYFVFRGMIMYGENFLEDFLAQKNSADRIQMINLIQSQWENQIIKPLKSAGVICGNYEQLLFIGMHVFGNDFVNMLVRAKNKEQKQAILDEAQRVWKQHQSLEQRTCSKKSKEITAFAIFAEDLIRLEIAEKKL